MRHVRKIIPIYSRRVINYQEHILSTSITMWHLILTRYGTSTFMQLRLPIAYEGIDVGETERVKQNTLDSI